jgi:hypothetical protein
MALPTKTSLVNKVNQEARNESPNKSSRYATTKTCDRPRRGVGGWRILVVCGLVYEELETAELGDDGRGWCVYAVMLIGWCTSAVSCDLMMPESNIIRYL